MLDPESLLGEDASVPELDARIQERVSLIASIDLQIADKRRNVESGDLDADDFRNWEIRAQERRQRTASELATLRYVRHVVSRHEGTHRVEAARLREELDAATTRIADVTAMAQARDDTHLREIKGLRAEVRDLRAEVGAKRDAIDNLRAIVEATSGDEASIPLRHHEGEQINVMQELQRARLKKLKEGLWGAMLEGEVAILYPHRRGKHLCYLSTAVPRDFRDQRVKREEEAGRPRPRTSAECDANEMLQVPGQQSAVRRAAPDSSEGLLATPDRREEIRVMLAAGSGKSGE